MMLKLNNAVQEQEASKRVKITSFKHLLKYKEVCPPLIQLLKSQGIWGIDLDTVYTALNILLFNFFSARQLLTF